jgi:hypothetical protein
MGRRSQMGAVTISSPLKVGKADHDSHADWRRTQHDTRPYIYLFARL